jgi:hypothetical protein
VSAAVTSADPDPTTRRWWAWLEKHGSASPTERPATDYDRAGTDDRDVPTQVLVRRVFARADFEQRRTLDLLLIGLVETADAVGPGSTNRALVTVGPDALRARTVVDVHGLTIGELSLGPVGSGLRRVSLALVRVTRGGRSQDVLASIEALGLLLDYRADPEGSAAVAQALVRRLEVLTSGPGVRVSVAGALRRPDTGQTLRLLTETALARDEEVELLDSGLTVVRAGSSLDAAPPQPRERHVVRERRPWDGGDYVLVRVGKPAAGLADGRPLARRRMDHALADVGFGDDARPEGDPYSRHVATVRQATRAQQILGEVTNGDSTSAVRRLAYALTQPGADGPLAESLATGLDTVADYWLLVAALGRTDVEAGAIAPVEERLTRRLDELMALRTVDNPGSTVPLVTPLVLEVSEALVPIVDSRLDGGLFLYELVPAMRDRIRERTGVMIPGVRARSNPALAAGAYQIQIEEIPLVTGVLRLDGRYAVRSVADEAVELGADVAEVHPITGEPGRWRMDPVEPIDGDVVGAEACSNAQYLIHRLERELVRGLRSMLGLQEVDALIEAWHGVHAALVARVIDGPAAQQRLTVLLQELVGEQVPILDWQTVLEAIERAGGITAHIRILQRAVRRAVRESLPGLRTGPTALRLPADIEALLVDREHGVVPSTDSTISAEAATAFSEWLRQSVAELGPVLTVITEDPEVRRRAAFLARVDRTVVHTLAAEEESG